MKRKYLSILPTSKIRSGINNKANKVLIPKKEKTLEGIVRLLCDFERISLPHIQTKKLARRALTYWVNDIGRFDECCRFASSDVAQLTQEFLSSHGHASSSLEENKLVICSLPGKKFYRTKEWESLRYKVLRERGNACECCGKSAGKGVEIHVDHIKPRSIFPAMALSQSNMQVLCGSCNRGKSNIYDDDWRS